MANIQQGTRANPVNIGPFRQIVKITIPRRRHTGEGLEHWAGGLLDTSNVQGGFETQFNVNLSNVVIPLPTLRIDKNSVVVSGVVVATQPGPPPGATNQFGWPPTGFLQAEASVQFAFGVVRSFPGGPIVYTPSAPLIAQLYLLNDLGVFPPAYEVVVASSSVSVDPLETSGLLTCSTGPIAIAIDLPKTLTFGVTASCADALALLLNLGAAVNGTFHIKYSSVAF